MGEANLGTGSDSELPSDVTSGSKTADERSQEENQKYKKQYFRDSRGRHCDAAKSKDGSYDGDDEEDSSIAKHTTSVNVCVEPVE
jgi:hypothetical protein